MYLVFVSNLTVFENYFPSKSFHCSALLHLCRNYIKIFMKNPERQKRQAANIYHFYVSKTETCLKYEKYDGHKNRSLYHEPE